MPVSFLLQIPEDRRWKKQASLLADLPSSFCFTLKWLCYSVAWNLPSFHLLKIVISRWQAQNHRMVEVGEDHWRLSGPDTPAFLWNWNGVIRCCWDALVLLSSGHTECVLCLLERCIVESSLAWRSFSERREMLRDAYLRRVYGRYCMDFSLYTEEGSK